MVVQSSPSRAEGRRATPSRGEGYRANRSSTSPGRRPYRGPPRETTVVCSARLCWRSLGCPRGSSCLLGLLLLRARMIGHAKNTRSVYDMMRKAGYGDEEFPNWWYSPVDDTSVHENDVSDDVDARRDVSDDVVTRTVPSGDEGYDVVPPRTPAPREDIPGRPTVRDETLHDGTRRDGTRNDMSRRDTTDDFTQVELNLLGSKGVVRSPQGEFINRILEKNGFTSEGVIRRESAGE